MIVLIFPGAPSCPAINTGEVVGGDPAAVTPSTTQGVATVPGQLALAIVALTFRIGPDLYPYNTPLIVPTNAPRVMRTRTQELGMVHAIAFTHPVEKVLVAPVELVFGLIPVFTVPAQVANVTVVVELFPAWKSTLVSAPAPVAW